MIDYLERTNKITMGCYLAFLSYLLISMSGHSLTLNITEMAKDTAIVTMEGK